MGVHGLTTYLRDNKRILSKTINHDPSHALITIVVDGWSFIYYLYNHSTLPWVYGGEYTDFSRLVVLVVDAWVKVGFKIYFVFDGACPELKFPTVVSRLAQSHIHPALLFFRTSPSSRANPRFLNETRIIPPLSYSTCIRALEEVSRSTDALEIFFADEEGDPFAVELAGRVGGYVVGNDSDFVVLNSDGYLGFVPIDEMIWYSKASGDAPPPDIEPDNDDFQTVRKPKAKRKPLNNSGARGILPPNASEDLKVSFIAYSPTTLAAHLKVPVTLLPLFGALLGNDFTDRSEGSRRNVQSLFFDRRLTPSQRIERVAATMRSVLLPVSQKRKLRNQVGSVMDLIDKTVNTLITRLPTTMGTGEIESVINNIVEATLQYAIPKHDGDAPGLWTNDVCALHEPDFCPYLPMISRRVMVEARNGEEPDEDLLSIRARYLDAYRRGHFSPKNMDMLNTGSSWSRLFLENPDMETVGRSIGRPLREWVWSILDDAVGLPDSNVDADLLSHRDTATDSAVSSHGGDEDLNEDSDELIDVVESDDESNANADDMLAPLKGELHRLHSPNRSMPRPPASNASQQNRRILPPIIIDYLRRGTRIAYERQTVSPLSELLSGIDCKDPIPLLLRPIGSRITVLLRILGSDLPSVKALPSDQLVAVIAIRWIVKTLHSRAQQTGSKDRERERWTRNEACCLLASFSWSSSTTSFVNDELDNMPQPSPPIKDRNIQLMAQILMALESVELLSQALLLTDDIPSISRLLSGRKFHFNLQEHIDHASIPPGMEKALEDGLVDAFQEEKAKKSRKKKQSEAAPSIPSNRGAKNVGLFALLGDEEVQ